MILDQDLDVLFLHLLQLLRKVSNLNPIVVHLVIVVNARLLSAHRLLKKVDVHAED